MRLRHSILIISMPRSPSNCPQYGPANTQEKSVQRNPASASVIIDAKPAQHFGSMLSQQRGGTAHHTRRFREVHRRCNVFVLANHGMLELGKEAYLVEVLVRCQVVGIAGHADRATK